MDNVHCASTMLTPGWTACVSRCRAYDTWATVASFLWYREQSHPGTEHMYEHLNMMTADLLFANFDILYFHF